SGLDERIDDAVAMFALQLAEEEEAQADRVARPVDLGEDGVVGAVIFPVRQGVAAKGVEQVEAAERVDLVFLDDAAADALEDVVQQARNALRGKGHARLPVGTPAV